MKPRVATWKSVVVTFVVAAIFYVAAYSFMMKKQRGRGPWQVDFSTNSAGVPQLVIVQPALGISNVTVQFLAEQLPATNGTGAVAFAQPRQTTPFGSVIYDDLMFQPGAVALDCFGHVVEMIPAALGLNGVRFGWTNGVTFVLAPTNRLPAEARKKFKGGYRR